MANWQKFSLLSGSLLLLALDGCRLPPPPLPPSRPAGRTLARPAVVNHWRYNYYPEVEVYFSPYSNLYFYLDNDSWVSAVILPPHIRIDLNNYEPVEIEDDRPWRHHQETLRNYPREKYRHNDNRRWEREPDDRHRHDQRDDRELRERRQQHERVERERDERERREQEARARERQRQELERREQERLENGRREQEARERDRHDREARDRERQRRESEQREKERLEKERGDRDRHDREARDQERQRRESEQPAKERGDKERGNRGQAERPGAESKKTPEQALPNWLRQEKSDQTVEQANENPAPTRETQEESPARSIREGWGLSH